MATEKAGVSDSIIFTLALQSGQFRSELRLPLPKTPAETNATVLRWLDFMATGLRLSAERMDAVLEPCAAARLPDGGASHG